MKLKKGVLQRRKGDGVSLVVCDKGDGFCGVIHSNSTVAFIIKCLKRETDEYRILAKMQRRFDGDPDEMLADIRTVLDELRRIGALTDSDDEPNAGSIREPRVRRFDPERRQTEIDEDSSLIVRSESKKNIEDILASGGTFIWSTRGTSMRPLLKTNRDVVEIKSPKAVYPDGKLRVNDVALYKLPIKRFEGQYILHRVRKVREGYYVICGDNNVFMEHVPFDWVIGVMSGLTRRGKEVNLNGFWYKAYVKHWGSRYRRRMIVKRIGHYVKKPLRPIYHGIKKLFNR